MELLAAMMIMLMVTTALAGLTRTAQQSYEYCDGYGVATQYARVVLDRIAQNVSQATANAQFPGCVVVASTVNSYTYPDTLVIWRPTGAPANPTGLPCFNELVIYCPNPASPGQLLEMTAPTNTGTVPAASDQAGWQTALATLQTSPTTNSLLLTTLMRTCSTSTSGSSGTQNLRGAVRFVMRVLPSATDWANYQAGSVTWMNLPWAQGIYGTQTGLRQVWVRMELQLNPGTDLIENSAAAVPPMPFFGSAALYYQMNHP